MDISVEILQVWREWGDIFKLLQELYMQWKYLKHEGNIMLKKWQRTPENKCYLHKSNTNMDKSSSINSIRILENKKGFWQSGDHLFNKKIPNLSKISEHCGLLICLSTSSSF